MQAQNLDSRSDPEISGGFVCVEGRRKITLQKVQPADWGTTSGDSTKRVRLSWGSTNIAVYTAATGGVAVISGTDYENANLPTNFWVEGVAVSATAGTSTVPGPETILAQAIPDGMYDRIGFTVYHVDSITVMPKNAPEGWTPPEPVTIGAGAIHSPAHQADVTIQVLPLVAGIPVDVRLIRGLSHEPGKEAELAMGTQIATGGGEAVTVLTGTDGTISGELTSSDVNDMDCTIRACATGTNVVFTWDEYPEQDEWTFEPGYLPVPGVLTNHLVLRHHRDPATCDPTNYTPWAPFNDHDIRFFVEKVEYWDAEGNLCETNNTAEAPSDLSAWATFPTNPVTTDADGRVTELLTIVTNDNLHSVTMVAYDWSVWRHEAAPPLAPLSGLSLSGGLGILEAPDGGAFMDSVLRMQKMSKYDSGGSPQSLVRLEPITAEANEHGVIYNPAGVGYGGLAMYKVYLAYEGSVADERIQWSIESGGVNFYSGHNSGRTAIIRGGSSESDFKLVVSIDGNPGPYIHGKVLEWKTVPIDVYIICNDAGVQAVSEETVDTWIAEANRIYKQVAMSFTKASVSFVTNNDWFDIDDSAEFAAMCSYANATSGLELYCVNTLPFEWAGAHSHMSISPLDARRGMAVKKDAPITTLAHEIGHACNLDHINYSLPNKVKKELVLEPNWSGGQGTGYHNPELLHKELVKRIIMHSPYSSLLGDIPLSPVMGTSEYGTVSSQSVSLEDMNRTPTH